MNINHEPFFIDLADLHQHWIPQRITLFYNCNNTERRFLHVAEKHFHKKNQKQAEVS